MPSFPGFIISLGSSSLLHLPQQRQVPRVSPFIDLGCKINRRFVGDSPCIQIHFQAFNNRLSRVFRCLGTFFIEGDHGPQHPIMNTPIIGGTNGRRKIMIDQNLFPFIIHRRPFVDGSKGARPGNSAARPFWCNSWWTRQSGSGAAFWPSEPPPGILRI